MPDTDFGTWVKEGPEGPITRTATTAGQAVKFQFDGWQRQEPLPPATVPSQVDTPPSAPQSVATTPARTSAKAKQTTTTSPTE